MKNKDNFKKAGHCNNFLLTLVGINLPYMQGEMPDS